MDSVDGADVDDGCGGLFGGRGVEEGEHCLGEGEDALEVEVHDLFECCVWVCLQWCTPLSAWNV